MSKIKCQLLSHSNGPHLQQAYTGFLMLQRRGLIDLEQRVSDTRAVIPTQTEHLRDARKAHLKVLVNGLTLHYDAHDSWEIDEEFLAGADYYFKRSFSEARVQRLEAREKIYPLGLYYNVYPGGVDWRGFKRSLAFIDRRNWRRAARPFDPLNWLGFTPRVHLMESLPDTQNVEPKVLFMARAWDPHDAADRTEQKTRERTQINDMRSDCIKALREAFGTKFYGGFMHRDHALKHYPDMLMPDPKAATKGAYIKLLQHYPICLATTGLHGSVGGKLAEYVAFSKAIVTEKLNYEVPGAFREERNYLTFSSPEQCVAQVQRLFENEALRREMMVNNARYYQQYLRPDALILNTLLTALAGGVGSVP